MHAKIEHEKNTIERNVSSLVLLLALCLVPPHASSRHLLPRRYLSTANAYRGLLDYSEPGLTFSFKDPRRATPTVRNTPSASAIVDMWSFVNPGDDAL